MTEYLMIGEILKPQGLRGECKIRSYAADISYFSNWSTVYIRNQEDYLPLSLAFHRIHEGFVYAVPGNCKTPEEVERLRGEKLYVDRAHAAPLTEGAYYIADLIGCRAIDEQGQILGKLTEVLQHGSVDTWVFSGSKPFMAPALRSVFPEVNVEEKMIRVLSGPLEEVAVFED